MPYQVRLPSSPNAQNVRRTCKRLNNTSNLTLTLTLNPNPSTDVMVTECGTAVYRFAKCLPLAKTHAFRRLRKSLIALLIVICGKSSQICCFYNVNKHVGYYMTSTVTSFAQEANLQVKF